jgi:hypothetical protein
MKVIAPISRRILYILYLSRKANLFNDSGACRKTGIAQPTAAGYKMTLISDRLCRRGEEKIDRKKFLKGIVNRRKPDEVSKSEIAHHVRFKIFGRRGFLWIGWSES